MSGRRKRAPPSRMNDEKKKQLCWNMHDDRKNEVIDLDAVDEDQPLAGTSSSSTAHVINDDSTDEALTLKVNNLKSLSFSTILDEADDSCHLLTSISIQLNIVIFPYISDSNWKTLLGEFILQPLPGQQLTENVHKKSFTLMRAEPSDHLRICVHVKNVEKVDEREESLQNTYQEDVLVESSLSNEMLEDLMWLQKKRVIVLCQRSGDGQCLKVFGLRN
nr:E3 ubiquitin-protein ligase SHPRH-like [Zootoca vivipara]